MYGHLYWEREREGVYELIQSQPHYSVLNIKEIVWMKKNPG